jgi:hypothetical protein
MITGIFQSQRLGEIPGIIGETGRTAVGSARGARDWRRTAGGERLAA